MMSSDREIVGQGARRGPKIGVHTFRNRLDVYSSNGSKKPELFKPILGLTYAPHTRHFELRSYRDNGGLTDGSPLFQIGARSIEWYMHTTEPTSDARVRLRKTQDGDVLLNMTTRDSLNAFISLLKRWCPRAKQIIVSNQELTKVFKSVTGYWNSLKQEREEQENAASDTAVAHRSDEVPEHTHGSSVSRRVLQPTQAKSASELAHAIWHEHVPKQMARIAQPDTGIAAACRSSSNLDYHVPVRRPDLQQSLAKTSDRSINAASRRPTTQLSRSSIPPASASSQRALNKETVNSVGSAVEPQPLLKLIAISDLRGGSYAKTGDVTVRYCIDCRYACADGESFYEWFTASDRGKGGQIALFEKNRMAEKWWTNDPPRIDFKLKEYEYHIPESLDELQRIEFNIELRSASLTLMTNWPPHDLGGESFRWPGAIRDWLASNNDNPIKQKLGLQAKVTFSKNGDKKQYVPLSLFLPDDSSIPLLKTPLRLVVELQYPAWWKPEPKPLNGSFNITSTRNRLADNVDPRAPKRRKIVADDERRPTLIKLLPRSMQPYVPTSTTHNNTFKLLPARWPLEDEQILVTARKAGSAFPEIQAAHFPKRSVDAVRRKHLSMTVEGKISSSSPTLPPLSPSQPSRSKSTTTTPSNTAQPPNQSLAIESISINSFDMHWTKDEEHLLFKERMLGRSFETIQTLYLPKRTVGALKRRFNDLSKAHEATMTRDQVQDDQGELDGSQGQNEASSEPSEGFRGENEATNDGSKVNDGTEEAADRGPSGPDLQEVPLVGVSWMVQAKHSLTKSSTEGKKSGYECYACGKSFGLFIEMMTHFKDLTDHRNTMFAVRFYSNKMAVQILIRDQTTLEKLALFGLTGDEERAKWKWFLELWNVSNGHPKHFDFTRSNSHGPKKRKEREDVFEDLPLPKKGKVTSAGSDHITDSTASPETKTPQFQSSEYHEVSDNLRSPSSSTSSKPGNMAPEQHQQRETPDKAIVPSSQKSEDLFESEGFIMTSHQPVEKPQVSNGPDADMTWFETYKASRLYDDSKLSNAEKEFKLHWVQFIQDEPRHASSHKVLPVVLEYFIANNWKWIWQDGNRRQSFTNMVSGMRELGMLDISAAQHTIESYFEPPTTPYDTTRKTYYRVSLTKDDLKLFRRDLIAMWTSLRWLFVREYKESRTAWKRALQQFVLIARPMLLEEDVGVAITDTLEVLKVILDDPYYKVSKDIRAWDMKVQEVVQFINGRKIVASAAFKNDDKRDKLYKFVHCKRSREEQMASKKTQAEKRGLVDQLESGLDVHMIEYFGAYEGHWEWRRVREIDLLCCWLNADLTPDAVIKLLDKEASCGDTIGPTGGLMEYTPVNLTLRGEQKGTYDDEDEDESDENEA